MQDGQCSWWTETMRFNTSFTNSITEELHRIGQEIDYGDPQAWGNNMKIWLGLKGWGLVLLVIAITASNDGRDQRLRGKEIEVELQSSQLWVINDANSLTCIRGGACLKALRVNTLGSH